MHQHYRYSQYRWQRTHGSRQSVRERFVHRGHGHQYPSAYSRYQVLRPTEYNEKANHERDELVREENNLRGFRRAVELVPNSSVNDHLQSNGLFGAMHTNRDGLVAFEIHALRQPVDLGPEVLRVNLG